VTNAIVDRAAVEDEMVRFGCLWLRQRGAKLTQCLLAPGELALGKPLIRNDVPHITALCYLRRSLSQNIPPDDGRIQFVPYAAQPHRFGETLVRTYEATQDCPELTGARTIDEILEGHRAQGEHDPARWWLALHGAKPAGVLLMTKLAEYASWDVCYVGIVPAARRQGLGRQLMLHALAQAAQARVAQVTLSVDDRNTAAWALYRQLGFAQFDRREVFLKVWGKA
jgi:ribosomal protein S18 acetylase RimI-like enzyme